VQVCKIAAVAPGDIGMVLRGATVATNMVIECKGAEVGMIKTRGFCDILHMARQRRPPNFSL
jgi:N-methylhydantoinase A